MRRWAGPILGQRTDEDILATLIGAVAHEAHTSQVSLMSAWARVRQQPLDAAILEAI